MKIEPLKGTHTIPFLWMHGEDEVRLREMVRVISDNGMGALCVESRPHPDFLGEKWWRDMDVIIDECKQRHMGVWILDDEHFPTGYSAGRAANTEHTVRYLTEFHLDIPGLVKGAGISLRLPHPYQNASVKNEVVSVVAARRIPGRNLDHTTYINLGNDPVEDIIDLTYRIDGDTLYWDVPDGTWRVFIISARYGTGSEKHDVYINPLEANGTRILLDTVYEAHYARYSDEFGKTIRGFFSDEPQFGGGYGYHAKLGSMRLLNLPWSNEVLSLMETTLGEHATSLLPGLWTDIGTDTSRVRFAYMDAVTRLYDKHFCTQIGDWCRAHGVEYMGHVIEENNAHARLGAGTGHYFRALRGQDFAGIDIVLSGLIPGLKGASHAQWSELFEADDDFYYYTLAQLAVSLSHIDSKKQGRAMCEIFGAYGWQEGLREMKWLADFMMSRGINYFVPHAFTPKAFPDPDCPPHFYADGENPQYRYFSRLIGYMNRVCTLISGGRTLTKVGVLYHAEAEWTGDYYMKSQEIVKLLTQAQIETDILPIDVLLDAPVSDGCTQIGQCNYEYLVVPHADSLSGETICALGRLADKGMCVIFAESLPRRSVTKAVDIPHILRTCRVASGTNILRLLSNARTLLSDTSLTDLKAYPYQTDKGKVVLLFNESVVSPIDTWISVSDIVAPAYYDPLDESVFAAERIANGIGLHLEPGQMLVLLSDTTAPTRTNVCLPYSRKLGAWNVSTATAKEYPVFTQHPEISGPCNLFRPQGLPRFSGTMRYESEFFAHENEALRIALGEVGETAEVFVNGKSVGIKIAPPYEFDLSGFAKDGKNLLIVDVTNTLVYQMRDVLSVYHPICPSGLIGPVTLWSEYSE